MTEITDITQSEMWIIKTTLKERYGKDMDIQLADGEIRLYPSDRELSSCPMVIWESDDCTFVIMKAGDRKYRCQFFYRNFQQYGTGQHEYDDLTECTVGLLQAQADHVAQERGDVEKTRR